MFVWHSLSAPGSAMRDFLQRFVIYALFTLTGVGQVLPGTLLPFLAQRWGIGDGRSGLLFFLFFLGSAVGALLARGRLGRMLAIATVSMAISVGALDQVRGIGVSIAFLLDGFGLGLAMTSISLLQSRREAAVRLAELNRLNLLWAAGACCGPFLLLHTTAVAGLAHCLHAAAVVLLLTGAVLATLLWNQPAAPAGTWRNWREARDIPRFFLITIPLVTGIEAAVGGWLTTYAERSFHLNGALITTATALWSGLLLSRALLSGRYAATADRRGWLTFFPALLVAGLVLLLTAPNAIAAATGAFLVGFGIGPLFPWLLTRLLDFGETGNAGFLAAGAGSTLMPFLTGQIAQLTHSLRAGLLVPAAGSLVLATVVRLPHHRGKQA